MEWFLVKVKYTKQLEDGALKRVTEPYLIDAMSFTDAEARAWKEVGETVKGEFIVTAISRETIHDIFNYEDSDLWFKCTIAFVSTDDLGRDKKVKQTIFLNAESVSQATERVFESLKGMMVDFEVKAVAESPVVDVFPYVMEEV
jgi:hypothetical protein